MTPRLSLLACLALPLLLTACTTPAQRITSNLTELGVPPRQAQCMGGRPGERLAIGQLRRLQELTGLRYDRFERMNQRQVDTKFPDDRAHGLGPEFVPAGAVCRV